MGVPPVVLHLIDSLGTGGAQQRLVNDLRYVNGAFAHRVYCLFDEHGNLADELRQPNISMGGLRLKSLSGLPFGVWRLARIVRSDPSIRLIHTQLFGSDTVGRLAGWLCGRPVISTSQSAVYEPNSGLNSPWRRSVDRWTGRAVRHFIAVSAFVKRSLHERLGIPLERISVIPNSVDLQRVTPNPYRRSVMRGQLGLAEQEFAWVTVGRLNPPKGYRYLLEGMVRVIERFPRTRLFVVGDGPDRPSLERATQALGLARAIRFLGERRDVVALLDAADGFVFPSLSEGLPVALLEAMAMEKPCVASRIGPHEELIEHGFTGLLATPRDPAGIAEAMCLVQSDPKGSRILGERARERVARGFDAATCARELRRLYEAVVAGSEKL